MLRERKQRNKRAVKGFRLPMLEYEEEPMNILDQIILDTDNTYFMVMDSDAMSAYGIFKGNILVIDKSIKAIEGAIIITYHHGEWYTREYTRQGQTIVLKGSDEQSTIVVGQDEILTIWGVVTVCINQLLPAYFERESA